MDADLRSAQSDLAFMKSLVDAGGRSQMTGGSLFVAGGLLYGFQCLVQWAITQGWIVMAPQAQFIFVVGVTVAVLAALVWVIVRNRNVAQGGLAARAVNAAFSAAGFANLAVIACFATVAIRQHNFLFWELYPPVVFALQSAAWIVAFSLRRRAWHLVVAFGWMISTVALGFYVGTNTYLLVTGVALIVFMAIPGLVMVRLARRTD